MAAKRYEEINGKNKQTSSVGSKLKERFSAASRGEQPDWGRIDPDLVWKLIQRCTIDDGAVMFGYSRDGGAYSLKIYAGGEPEKAYLHSDAEMVDFITYLLEE